MLALLMGREDMTQVNQTFIVLIPKVASSEELGQFRPISLCNVLYKVASKVLANRLKIILPEILAEEQSAFIPERLITDNIISAFECIHVMKNNSMKKHQFCALKLDMRKANNRIEWEYLQVVMLKLGFHSSWIEMTMRLVTRYSSGRSNFSLFVFVGSRGPLVTVKI